MADNLSERIRAKALELGYDACGIIKMAAMEGYAKELEKRIERFPESKPHLERLYPSANADNYAWAKSIVVCSRWYGHYRIPEHLKNRIGKIYLTDMRTAKDAVDLQASLQFKQCLKDLGLRVKSEGPFGIPGLRWAAKQAGIGIVRKNNFFYTKRGSYAYIEAWYIDQELEFIVSPSLKPCPDNCTLCIERCPTAALAESYATNYNTCVCNITTWEAWDLPNEPYREKLNGWIYGCDVCQDVCPYNKKAWTEDDDFPGLEEIGQHISLEKIVTMDYDFLREVINAKFFYISKEYVWKWKTNALNAMLNHYQPSYYPYIEQACGDQDEHVRSMAEWVKTQIPSP